MSERDDRKKQRQYEEKVLKPVNEKLRKFNKPPLDKQRLKP
jgi:hypothetical protein